jgi:hypothetical protein
VPKPRQGAQAAAANYRGLMVTIESGQFRASRSPGAASGQAVSATGVACEPASCRPFATSSSLASRSKVRPSASNSAASRGPAGPWAKRKHRSARICRYPVCDILIPPGRGGRQFGRALGGDWRPSDSSPRSAVEQNHRYSGWAYTERQCRPIPSRTGEARLAGWAIRRPGRNPTRQGRQHEISWPSSPTRQTVVGLAGVVAL